jgi:hypothetical protein
MLFSEASKISVNLEKQANCTGKTARATKDDYFSSQKIRNMILKMLTGKGDLKDISTLSNKTKRQIDNIRNMTDNKHKTPINRIRKRYLMLLRRSK